MIFTIEHAGNPNFGGVSTEEYAKRFKDAGFNVYFRDCVDLRGRTCKELVADIQTLDELVRLETVAKNPLILGTCCDGDPELTIYDDYME